MFDTPLHSTGRTRVTIRRESSRVRPTIAFDKAVHGPPAVTFSQSEAPSTGGAERRIIDKLSIIPVDIDDMSFARRPARPVGPGLRLDKTGEKRPPETCPGASNAWRFVTRVGSCADSRRRFGDRQAHTSTTFSVPPIIIFNGLRGKCGLLRSKMSRDGSLHDRHAPPALQSE